MTAETFSMPTNYPKNGRTEMYMEQLFFKDIDHMVTYTWVNKTSIMRRENTIAIFIVKPKQIK